MNANLKCELPEDISAKDFKQKFKAVRQRVKKKLYEAYKEYGYLLYAGLIPTVIMYLLYVAHGIHPFGDGSVLVLDLNAQYVSFYEAIRNAVYGDTSLLYSFSRALGGEFMGIVAYYVASPFTYIVCLFPQSRILEALLTIFLIKTACLGITFGFYLHKTVPGLKKIPRIAFSILYALSSYAIVHQHNSMWIDAVIWLPIISYSIEQLIKHGKYKMFVFFLSLTLISNYYIGYMVCLYTAAYFFYYYIANNEKFKNNPSYEKNHFWKSLLRIGAYSVLAVGISAIIIFTAYYSLQFGKNTFQNTNWALKLRFDFLEFIGKLLPGSYDSVKPEGYPFVYCGVISLILAPLFFISKKYSAREKIAAGGMITFFLASFSFSTLDLIWHGFQRPNWLNYRYSFMFCFFLLVIAAKAFADIQDIGTRPIFLSSCLLGVIVMILQAQEYKYVKDFETVWFSAICIGLYLIILCITVKTKFKNNLAIIMTVVICLETFGNGVLNMVALDNEVAYSGYQKYTNYFSEIRPIVKMVQENDKSFYRMEKTTHKMYNDNLALNIRGLSCSTSTLNKETLTLLNSMGYCSASHKSQYRGGTPVNDSILGLKYILSKDDLSEFYEAAYTANGYTAYLNPYALSIAFGVDDDIKKYDSNENGKGLALDDKGFLNPFDAINALVTAMLGEKELIQVFVPVPLADISKSNVTESSISGYAKYVPDPDAPKDSVNVTYKFELPEYTGEYYFYQTGVYPRKIKIYANGKNLGDYFDGTFNSRIVSLGKFNAGEDLSVRMNLLGDNMFIKKDSNYVYYVDREVFESVMSRLAEMQLQIDDNYTETYLCGTFNSKNDNQTVLTTIPYDEGWKLKIDGKQAPIYKSLESLVTFDIDTAGEHYIELTYRPKAFVLGCVVSVVFLMLFILLIIFEKYLKKLPILKTFFTCVPCPALEALAKEEEESSEAENSTIPAVADGEKPEESGAQYVPFEESATADRHEPKVSEKTARIGDVNTDKDENNDSDNSDNQNNQDAPDDCDNRNGSDGCAE